MARGCLKDQVFIAFDLETTGLSAIHDRILEVGAVRFSLQEGILDTFNQLFNPERDIPSEVIAIHGITNWMVRQAPLFREQAAALQAFFKEGILLAHNASFDLAFLSYALHQAGQPPISQPVIDTCRLARLLLPGAPNYKLSTLIEHFKLKTYLPTHRALPDALACVALFELCVARLSQGAETPLDVFWTTYPSVSHALIQEVPDHPLGPMLCTAIQQQQDICIGYHNARNERTERVITPLFLAGRGSHTYLEAFCHLRQENRQFRLDRLYSLTVP